MLALESVEARPVQVVQCSTTRSGTATPTRSEGRVQIQTLPSVNSQNATGRPLSSRSEREGLSRSHSPPRSVLHTRSNQALGTAQISGGDSIANAPPWGLVQNSPPDSQYD